MNGLTVNNLFTMNMFTMASSFFRTHSQSSSLSEVNMDSSSSGSNPSYYGDDCSDHRDEERPPLSRTTTRETATVNALPVDFTLSSTATRRRGRAGALSNGLTDDPLRSSPSKSDEDSPSKRFWMKRSRKRQQSLCGGARCHPLCGCISTILFTTSVLLWLTSMPLLWSQSILDNKRNNVPVRERIKRRNRLPYRGDRNPHERSPMMVLYDQADSGLKDIIRGFGHRSQISPERAQSGCYRPEWQEFSFPNCNDIHEIDLRTVLERAARQGKHTKLGYITSGFWRSVWSVDPRQVMKVPVVLKMMLPEHEITDRNFDRHRRDALVMERLTSSPYVVDTFGFCGNTVLTEYIETPLDYLIDDTYDRQDGMLSRDTAQGRLALALEVAKGLQALHEMAGGPIVHADIQARQFLVTPDGSVKVNDFNRCRFMAHRNTTDEPCMFRIGSAPGKARSPEEYAKSKLDEKLDIYSTANIYYGILTGQLLPWSDFSTKEMQKKSQKGVHPAIQAEFRKPGSTDEALADLTMQAYALDPKDRPSASDLVAAIQKLLKNTDAHR